MTLDEDRYLCDKDGQIADGDGYLPVGVVYIHHQDDCHVTEKIVSPADTVIRMTKTGLTSIKNSVVEIPRP